MSAGSSLAIGTASGAALFSYLGKSSEIKFHLAPLFGLGFSIYISVLSNPQEQYLRLCTIILSVFILPFLYALTISWKLVLFVQLLQGSVIISIIGYGMYGSSLDLSLLLQANDYIFCGFQVASMLCCSCLIAYGYSQIPDLLITPPLKHFFSKNSLETSKLHAEKAISNIGYQYICRGLPTPKFEQSNLKTMQKELERLSERISKFEKNSIDNRYLQAAMVSGGCFLVCAGFWIYGALMGVLIEGIVISKCGWRCGFEANSRINELFADVKWPFAIVVLVTYLGTAFIGYIKAAEMKLTENKSETLIGTIAVCCIASVGLQAVLGYFFPKDYSTDIEIVSFCSQALLCSGAFLMFIYWNFLKCKDR